MYIVLWRDFNENFSTSVGSIYMRHKKFFNFKKIRPKSKYSQIILKSKKFLLHKIFKNSGSIMYNGTTNGDLRQCTTFGDDTWRREVGSRIRVQSHFGPSKDWIVRQINWRREDWLQRRTLGCAICIYWVIKSMKS